MKRPSRDRKRRTLFREINRITPAKRAKQGNSGCLLRAPECLVNRKHVELHSARAKSIVPRGQRYVSAPDFLDADVARVCARPRQHAGGIYPDTNVNDDHGDHDEVAHAISKSNLNGFSKRDKKERKLESAKPEVKKARLRWGFSTVRGARYVRNGLIR